MIESVYQVGKYYERTSKKDGLEELVDKSKVDFLVGLKFSIDGEYIGFELLEEYQEGNTELKTLLKKGSSRGGNYTPTLNLTDPEKALSNILRPISKISIFKSIENKLLEILSEEKSKKNILNELNNLIDKKKKYLLTLIVDNKFLLEYDEVKNIIFNLEDTGEEYTFRKSFSKEEQISKASNKTCFICKKKKENIFGFTNTYNFYTLDKPGFMTGGFNRKNAWKNYPVCSDCAKTLKKGRKFIDENLCNRFTGLDYMIIPKLILQNKTFEEDYDDLIESLLEKTKISLSEGEQTQNRRSIFDQNDIMVDIMKEANNFITYDIIFYNVNKAQYSLLKRIEDVYPSRLKKLFEYKDEVSSDDYPVFSEKEIKGNKIFLNFNFGIFREFFPNSSEEGDFDKEFLEIIYSIFLDKKISEESLIHAFLRRFYHKVNRNEGYYISCLRSFLILMYLKAADLLNENFDGEEKTLIMKTDKNGFYLEFLDKYSSVLNSNLKRSIFLQGAATQTLLNTDEQRENHPFMARLNGLKLNERIFKRILVETKAKLMEYKKSHYNLEIDKLISHYLLDTEWKQLTNEEISYYFILGMNLNGEFNKIKKGE